MMHRHLLHRAAAMTLAAVLCAAPAAAAPDRLSFHPFAEAEGLLAPLWGFFASLLPDGEDANPGETLDNRCTIDPNGQPSCGETGSPGESLDNRCGIDPDGRIVCGDTAPPNG